MCSLGRGDSLCPLQSLGLTADTSSGRDQSSHVEKASIRIDQQGNLYEVGGGSALNGPRRGAGSEGRARTDSHIGPLIRIF